MKTNHIEKRLYLFAAITLFFFSWSPVFGASKCEKEEYDVADFLRQGVESRLIKRDNSSALQYFKEATNKAMNNDCFNDDYRARLYILIQKFNFYINPELPETNNENEAIEIKKTKRRKYYFKTEQNKVE